ncbi:MAG: restriction endonuclease subunit S [Rhodocyclaceae bacterium]|nr:restriction endonuclease subunit S [Rhodocyclaceae bacterium]MDZ4214320.1 restriction endonuclease subunit S [Rhodocyclaceae bacterium]
MNEVWEIKPLGEVCKFQRGLTYAKTDEVDISDNIVLRATNIDLATNLLDLAELKYINDSVVVGVSKKVKRDSLLICTASGSKSHLGKVAYIDDDYDFAFGGFMGMLTPDEGILPRYFFHLMTSGDYKDFIAALSDGANINNLKFSDLQQFPVPVAPLPEQHRIVAILDAAFDGIATAKANAEQNLQNARALFDSHLESILRSKAWEWKTLGDLCDGVEYGSSAKSQKEGRVPVLRMGNIQDGQFDWENLVYSDDEDEIAKYQLKHNDVLFNRTNSPELVGKTAIYKGEMPAIFAGYLIRIRRKEDLLDGDYLNYFLNSQIALDYGKTVVISSVNQANINGAKLKGYPIPVPSLQDQRIIVKKLNSIREETQRLESLYRQKLAALEALKKSLLHQAFSGAL